MPHSNEEKIILTFHQISWSFISANKALENRLLSKVGHNKGADLFKILGDFFTHLQTNCCNDNDSSISFSVSKLTISPTNRQLKGIIQAGEYGKERKILEALSPTEVGKIHPNQHVPSEFYFLIEIPLNGCAGAFIIERNYVEQVKSLINHLKRNLDLHIQAQYPTCKIDIIPSLPEQFQTKFLEEGLLREIVLVKELVHKDEMEHYESGSQINECKKKTSIIPHSIMGFNKTLADELKKKALQDYKSIGQLVGIKDLPDSIQLKVTLDHDTKTFIFCGTEKFICPNISITIPSGKKNKEDQFDFIDTEALKLLDLYK